MVIVLPPLAAGWAASSGSTLFRLLDRVKPALASEQRLLPLSTTAPEQLRPGLPVP